jgi:hypothetical protein
MNNGVLAVVLAETTDASKDCKGDIKEKLRAAMKVAKNHWLAPDQDTAFRGAIGGVMQDYGEGSEEYESLKWEINQIKKLNAFLNAASAGLSPSFSESEEKKEPIGIMNIWRES